MAAKAVVALAHACLQADEIGFVALEESFFETVEEGTKVGLNLSRLSELYSEARHLSNSTSDDLIEAGLTVCVLLNADLEMAWNERRRRVNPEDATSLQREIHLTSVVLSKHFKSSPTWAHRLWALRHLITLLNINHDESTADAVFQKEFEICHRVAHAYRRCYNAWCFRVEVAALASQKALEEERRTIRSWMLTHVSDYSAMNHCQALLRLLGNKQDAVLEEMSFANTLISRYPGHEALWQHVGNLATMLLQVIPDASIKRFIAQLASSLLVRDEELTEDALEVAAQVADRFYQRDVSNVTEWREDRDVDDFLIQQLWFAIACGYEAGCINESSQQRGAMGFLVRFSRAVLLRSGQAFSQTLREKVIRLRHQQVSSHNKLWQTYRTQWRRTALECVRFVARS